MKITFICPKLGKRGLNSLGIFRMPPLGLIQLASLTPLEWEIEIVDENKKKINFDKPTDLVALSAMTALAPRAYEIADAYRKKNVPVIMGGIHASIMPEEAGRHVDSVVIGEPDNIWADILNDFKTDNLKKTYKVKEHPDLTLIRSVRKISRKIPYPYPFINAIMIQTSRGCPFACDFCSVSQFNGRKIRHRSIESVVQEIKENLSSTKKNYLVFVDDNIVADPSYALELFKAIEPLGINWLSQTDIRIALDEKLLKSAVKSGLKTAFIGFEAIDKDSLKTQVSQAKAGWHSSYKDAIKRLHENGVVVEGAFVFGLDTHTKDIFERTVEWAINNNIDMAQFTVNTPFPGTVFFERLHKQGRIITRKLDGSYNWKRFNAANVVIEPARMTRDELRAGLEWSYKKFYSYSSIFSRMRKTRKERSLLENVFLGLINIYFHHFLRYNQIGSNIV